MEFPLQIPYYAPHAPCALPSKQEIKAAKLLSDFSTLRVARVGEHFIVKYGAQVSPIEGENLVYVKQATSVPVPQVYAIYSDPDENCNYIVMEYIQGETLAVVWPSLNVIQKQIIASTLKSYLKELRALPSPNYFGSIGKRPLLESMFWTPEAAPSISGPFDTEAELNEGMAKKYDRFGPTATKVNFYRRAFPSVFSGHPAVFTHADLQRKNIVVNIISDDKICVTLVDWEKAGWLPSYWEYAAAMLSDAFRDDWSEWLDKIMEPFYAEYPYLKMLQLELWS